MIGRVASANGTDDVDPVVDGGHVSDWLRIAKSFGSRFRPHHFALKSEYRDRCGLIVVNALRHYDPNRGSFVSILFCSALSAWTDILRKHNRRRCRFAAWTPKLAREDLDPLAIGFDDLVELLSGSHREAVVRRCCLGMTFTEASRLSGRSRQSERQKYQSAIRELRKQEE